MSAPVTGTGIDTVGVILIKRRIRFIHTADLHLGSPLTSMGQTSGRLAEILKKATFTAMERICDAAIEQQVDFMVIAGDLYDREARSIKAGYFLMDQFKRLDEHNIPVFIIAGNHDPLSEGSGFITYPQNVHVFGCAETECKEALNREGEIIARLIGRSYKTRFESEKVFETFGPFDDQVWNIALLHTALEPMNPHYLPCTAQDLANVKNIDYWALGHAHTLQIILKEPLMVYPGIPQGRAPDEPGLGGCLLVELIPGKEGNISYIPVSPVVWRTEEVKIDSSAGKTPENIDELEELLRDKAQEVLEESFSGDTRNLHLRPFRSALPRKATGMPLSYFDTVIKGYIVRWVLSGRGEIHRSLSAQGEEAEEALLTVLRRRFGPLQGGESPFLWSESIRFKTGLPLPDLSELQEDETFRELEKVIEALKTEGGSKLVTKALGEVWQEETGEEGYNPEKMQYRKDGLNSLDSLMEDAKELVIEKIMERRNQR